MPIQIWQIAAKHGDTWRDSPAKAQKPGFRRWRMATGSLDRITAKAIELASPWKGVEVA
jgi:hypothetical protein